MKNLSKTSLRLFHAKKAAPKTPNNKFSKISKTSHYAKAIYSLSKMVSLGQTLLNVFGELKLAKNMPKTTLEPHKSSSMQKATPETT